jgi:cyclophilin family peptidyl-prolyl cis-trans isomerase
MFQRSRSFGWLAVVLLVAAIFTVISTASAQNGADSIEEFSVLNKKWKALDGEVKRIVKDFSTADEAGQTRLRKEYEDIAKRQSELLPMLRKSAIETYKAAPNSSEDLGHALVVMAATDLGDDNYAASSEIVSMLVENKYAGDDLPSIAGGLAYCTHDFEAAERYFNAAQESDTLDGNSAGMLPGLAETKKQWVLEEQIRQQETEAKDLPRVLLKTSKGDLQIELYENQAPQAVANFVALVEKGYYDGLTFHRVLGSFMAQAGCPQGTGSGGPGYRIFCECHKEPYRRHFTGTLSMAHAGRDTGGSQFFLTFRPTPHLDGRHTAFGRVVEGLDVLPKLQRIDPSRRDPTVKPDRILEATVLRKRDHVYQPTKVK